MASQHASLDDVPLLRAASIRWEQSVGVAPYVTTLFVHRSNLQKLLDKQGQPGRLVVGSGSGETGYTVEKVFVVSEAPSNAPFIAGVLVADVRWLWQRVWIRRHYNAVRKSGNRQMLEGGPVELNAIVDTFTFHAWSLAGGKIRWKPLGVLQDVLKGVQKQMEAIHAGGKGKGSAMEFSVDLPLDVDSLPIEDLQLDDPGDAAILRALGNVPRAEVSVDLKGKVHVFDRLDFDAAKRQAKDLGPETVVGGHLVEVLQEKIRPSAIDVLFDRELELRWDAKVEGGDGSDGSEEVEPGAAGISNPDMVNVLPIPDLTLKVGNRTLYRGTWAPLPDVLAAWNKDLKGAPLPLTIENLRKYWFYGLWNIFTEIGKSEPRPDWVNRLSTLRAHFRQTYQLSRSWMDRIKSLRGYRVAVVDPVTGARAPTLVESDYCVQPSERVAVDAAQGKGINQFFMWENVKGYPDDGSIASGHPAPAYAQVVDEDLGIIHIAYRTDPWGLASCIHPSMIVNAAGEIGGPTVDFRYQSLARNSPIVDGSVKGTNDGILLSNHHRALVVLTAAPGAPNNERQLHRIRITPSDVAQIVPKASQGGSGPVWQVRVPASTYTARFLWDDHLSKTLYPKVFGFGSFDPDQAGLDSDELDKGELFQNRKECESIAKAVAAAVYTRLADHLQGRPVHHVHSGAEPKGNLASVAHRLDPDGRLLTELSIPPEVKPVDFFSLMDARTRALVLGLVQGKPSGGPIT